MADRAGRRLYTPPPWRDGNPVCTLSTRPEVKHDLGGELREFLAGEHLLALVDMKIAPGRRAIDGPQDAPSRGQQVAGWVANAAMLLLGGGNSPSLSKMLRVESISARGGSWAYRLLRSWQEDRSGLGRLLVTDRRFTLVSRRTRGNGDRYRALLDIPGNAVADVRLIPKPMVRGRVVLLFTDGSLIALKYGTWRTGVARRVVDAVSQWRMQAFG